MIIDIHTHCFPKKISDKAITSLSERSQIDSYIDGTVESLKKSMQKSGIDISVVQHIATKPQQTHNINKWACDIQDDNIISFGTIHPDYPYWKKELEYLKNRDIKGIKFHPDYQNFYVDDEKMFTIYEKIFSLGFIVLFHAGIDIGLPEPCHCTPKMLSNVIDKFPDVNIIAAHMGGYMHWNNVKKFLAGKNIYLDTSYSYNEFPIHLFEQLINIHGSEKILFGTDSPWKDQVKELKAIKSLNIDEVTINNILGINAAKILEII